MSKDYRDYRIMSDSNPTQKTILITGATKGIGLALSERLLSKHYRVIGIARQNSAIPYPGIFFACDLSDSAQTQKTLNMIKQEYPIDGIVNNVGLVLPQAVGEIDLKSLMAVYDLNVRTAVQVTQTFLSHMQSKQFGRIVNIASRAIFGIQQRSSYAAAKCGLIGLTKTWAVELAEAGITVNAIAPGPIETELFRQVRPIGSAAEQAIIASMPMKRIGKPAEVAAAIEFLLSDDAGFITGQVLCVDGGSSL